MHKLLQKWSEKLPYDASNPEATLDVTEDVVGLMLAPEEGLLRARKWVEDGVVRESGYDPRRAIPTLFAFSPAGLHEAIKRDTRKAEDLLTGTGSPSKWDVRGMQQAELCASWSEDDKITVGAAIFSNDSHTPAGMGFNGRRPGCETEKRASREQGASEMLHAEQNAIARVRWEYGEKHSLFVTHEPCHECALLILAARHINRVVYAQPYEGDGRRRRGSEILREAGVEVMEWGSS